MSQGASHPATQPIQLLEHIIGTLLHVWWQVARIGLIAGVVVALATEIAGGVVTHHFPGGMTHLAALILGVAAAYAAAATALVSEILLAVLNTVRVLEGDVEAGAQAAAAIARQEARTASHDLASLLGFGRPAQPSTSPVRPATLAQRAPVYARPLQGAGQTTPSPGRVASEAFAASLPPQLPPLPVPADQLPRIQWAEEAERATPAGSMPAGSENAPAPASPAQAGAGRATTANAPGNAPHLLEHAIARLEPLAPLAALGAAAVAVAVEHRGAEPHDASPSGTTPLAAATTPLEALAQSSTPPVTPPAEPITQTAPLLAPSTSSTSSTTPLPPAETGGPEEPVVVPALTTPGTGSAFAGEASAGAGLYEDAPLVPPPTMPSQPFTEEAQAVQAAALPDLASQEDAADTPGIPADSGAMEHAAANQATVQAAATESDQEIVPPPAPEAANPPVAPEPRPVLDPQEGPPTIPRGAVPRPTRPLAPVTSPLAVPNSDPLSPPPGSGNLWDRLSRALMGIPPLQEDSGAAAGTADAAATPDGAEPADSERP